MTRKLSDKWLKPKRAKASAGALEAWWYGEADGLHVVIQTLPSMSTAVVAARVPRALVLQWADEIRGPR